MRWTWSFVRAGSDSDRHPAKAAALEPFRRASFESLPQWIADARALASPDLVLVIVGNKLDEEDDREVEYLEAARFAKENALLFTLAGRAIGNRERKIGSGTSEFWSKLWRAESKADVKLWRWQLHPSWTSAGEATRNGMLLTACLLILLIFKQV
ncbi:hypothetical protein EMMF5_003224 [Cystobasidiomycetes sp. EMM_F5]